jgi:hypothetical protein
MTQSSLFVGHDSLTPEDGGSEISDAGVPGPGTVLTNAAGNGNFYPQVTASTAEGKWMLTTAHNFSSIVAQFAAAPVAFAAPAITRNPATVVARLGTTVTFTAAASGGPAPSVQWQAKAPGAPDFTSIPGATSGSFAIFVTPADAGKLFRAVFTNTQSSVISTAAALIVRPTLNDLDGDGRTDPLIWRPGNGTFFWANSSTSNLNAPSTGQRWGDASLGDISLTGDLDGDGVSDLVVFRPSIGTWFWLTSSTGYSPAAFHMLTWGGLGDVPILADIDGDGSRTWSSGVRRAARGSGCSRPPATTTT